MHTFGCLSNNCNLQNFIIKLTCALIIPKKTQISKAAQQFFHFSFCNLSSPLLTSSLAISLNTEAIFVY